MKRSGLTTAIVASALVGAAFCGVAPAHAGLGNIGNDLGSSTDANRSPRAVGGISCSADGSTCSIDSISPDHRADSDMTLWHAPSRK